MIWEINEAAEKVEGLDEDGRPDPAYASALGLKTARKGPRALASAIEFAMWSVLQLPFWLVGLPPLVLLLTGALQPWGLASHPNLVWIIVTTSVSAALTLAFAVVQIVLHGKRGVTLGKAFTGIRSVNVKTLARPGIGKALLRAAILGASFLVPLVGPALFLLSPLLDAEKRGRGWLDLVAGTWFVDVRLGLDPYHEKKMRIARKTVTATPLASPSQLPSLATPTDLAERGWRPGARVSAGVVGAAVPGTPGREEPVGLASRASEPAPTETISGMPPGGAQLGGYRPGELSGTARPVTPPPAERFSEKPRVDRAGDAVQAQPTSEVQEETMPPMPARLQSEPRLEGATGGADGGALDGAAGLITSAPLGSPPSQDASGARQSAPPIAPPPGPGPVVPQASAVPAAPQASMAPVAEDTMLEFDAEASDAPGSAASADSGWQPQTPSDVDETTIKRAPTVDRSDLEQTHLAPHRARPVAKLVFDSGESFAIRGAALVGRNPAASAGETIEHLLPISDSTRTVSKTHLLVVASPLAVIDRASTNGVSVKRDGDSVRLTPGEVCPLRFGDRVQFGDRTFVIEPPDDSPAT